MVLAALSGVHQKLECGILPRRSFFFMSAVQLHILSIFLIFSTPLVLLIFFIISPALFDAGDLSPFVFAVYSYLGKHGEIGKTP